MKKEVSFEKGLARLEAITQGLEDRTLSLDQALKSFAEGLDLADQLSAKLTQATKQVEVLKKTQSGWSSQDVENLAAETLEDGNDDDDKIYF